MNEPLELDYAKLKHRLDADHQVLNEVNEGMAASQGCAKLSLVHAGLELEVVRRVRPL